MKILTNERKRIYEALGLVLAFLVVGCSKTEQSKTEQPSQTAAVPADNSGRNERDRNDATKTAGDQAENEADRQFHKTSGRPLSRMTPFQRMVRTSRSSQLMAR